MKVTKQQTKWIIGLIVAILTAVMSYVTVSCSVCRSSTILVDSTHVGHVEISSSTNGTIDK